MDQCKILFLAANPQGTTQLALDKEFREIETKIRASEHRDSLDLVSRWAVRPDDLLQALLEHRPRVVHFSGHGGADEIVLMGSDDQPKPVDKEDLAYLFGTLKDNIRLVLLNACYSRLQADLITQHIDCVVGMNKAIGDEAAIVFAASFYRAIGFGHSVQKAFEQGKAALMLEDIPEENTPELIVRPGVDAAEVVFVQAPTSHDSSENEAQMKDQSNRSVSIGGNVTGGAIVTGDHNVTSLQYTQTILAPAETINIGTELAAVRDLLRELRTDDAKKIDRALEDAQDELTKSEPNRDEVGDALDRALRYAQKAEGFAETATKLKGHVSNVVSWLGDNWHKLLSVVGLTL